MIEGAERRFKAILVSLTYIYIHIHLFPSIYNHDASSSADPVDFLRSDFEGEMDARINLMMMMVRNMTAICWELRKTVIIWRNGNL